MVFLEKMKFFIQRKMDFKVHKVLFNSLKFRGPLRSPFRRTFLEPLRGPFRGPVRGRTAIINYSTVT